MAVTEAKLEYWAKKKNFKKLHKALEIPDHQIRSKAVLCLALLQNPASIPHLEKLIDDRFEAVLRHTAYAIRAINPDHPSIQAFEQAALKKMEPEQEETSVTQGKYVAGDRPKSEGSAGNSYEDYLKRRSRWERPKAIAFTVIAIIGFGLILYILYQRLDWRDLLR